MPGNRRPFKTLLADPAWAFRDQGSRIAPSHAGHYDVMDLSEVIGMGLWVRSLTAANAHLWLAAPNALVLDGTAALVCEHWGFKPKQLLTWVKGRIGMGHWMRNSTEQIVLAVRGRLGPLQRNVPTHLVAPAGAHSAKPDELYDLIEQVSPGPRLELFARRERKGWRSWGNQAPKATRLGANYGAPHTLYMHTKEVANA